MFLGINQRSGNRRDTGNKQEAIRDHFQANRPLSGWNGNSVVFTYPCIRGFIFDLFG